MRSFSTVRAKDGWYSAEGFACRNVSGNRHSASTSGASFKWSQVGKASTGMQNSRARAGPHASYELRTHSARRRTVSSRWWSRFRAFLLLVKKSAMKSVHADQSAASVMVTDGCKQEERESRTQRCVLRQRQWHVRHAAGESFIFRLPEEIYLEFGEPT